MKTPTIDWENSSDEFIASFERNTFESFRNLDRGDVEAIITADIARAQRMAATGLRHLRAILGANRNAGKLDRWRRDALAPVYFGRVSRVGQIRSVHRRLERAHRRLRDDRLHVRMREQRHGTTDTTSGRNVGGFLSPRRFQLFPSFAGLEPDDRAAVIVHELLHEWLTDQRIGDETVRGDSHARRLASRDPEKARRNPENFEQFLLQVWADEGLEAPSRAERRDNAIHVHKSARADATGLLADRPVITPATAGGRQDLVFAALRARSDNSLVPAVFEYDTATIARRGNGSPTGETSYPAACCTLPDGTVITAVRATGDRRLLLIAWDVENEVSVRLDDSGNTYGDVHSQPDVIALGGGRMCVVFKGRTGKMKVDLVEYTRGRGFRRYANAETSGPIDDHGRVCLISPVDEHYGRADEPSPDKVIVATAFRTREGRLSMDLWSGDFGQREVRRHGGLVDRKITGRPAIAALALNDRPQVVTAVRDDDTGRLRLTAYDVADPGRPRRLGDTGAAGPRMSHSPDMVTVMEGSIQQVATAIRFSETGRLIVSTWSPPDDTSPFIRHRYSGIESTPVIDSSPSLVAIEGDESEDLLTAAIHDNGRLALDLWGEPRRTNG